MQLDLEGNEENMELTELQGTVDRSEEAHLPGYRWNGQPGSCLQLATRVFLLALLFLLPEHPTASTMPMPPSPP